MRAELTMRAVASGRGIDISVGVPDYPVPDDEDDGGEWAWLARMRIGDRVFTAGADTNIYEGATWGELDIRVDKAWLPTWAGPREASIDVAIWHRGEWRAWTGRDLVECSRPATIPLVPCAPLEGAPFDSPRGPTELNRRTTTEPSRLLPDHGILSSTTGPATGAFVLRGFDGVERPIAIPAAPRSIAGFKRIEFAPPDRIALFRDTYDHKLVVTLCTLSAPEQAVHVPCYLAQGNFDETGTRFWIAKDKHSFAAIDFASGRVIGEHPAPANLCHVQLRGDRLYFVAANALDVAPVAGGPRQRIAQTPVEMPVYDAGTNQIAWSSLISAGAPLGVRSVLRWLDLGTFEGGEAVVGDTIHHVAPIAGGAVAIGTQAWHATALGARDLGRADTRLAFDLPRITTDSEGQRYWSTHLPSPHYVAIR